MKKIIIFAKNLKIGGMEKALITLLNSIDAKKYQVTLVLEKKEGKLCECVSKNVKIIDYRLATNRNIFIRKARNLIKKIIFKLQNYNKYDCAINYATYSVWGSQMALMSSQNSIIFIHSDYYNVFNGNIEKIKAFFETIKVTEFNKIVFVSKHSRENVIKIIPEISEKSIVLGNLIDYENIVKKSNEFIPEMDSKKINLIFLGRLEEESKQLEKLIQKFNNSKLEDKFNLYIIGTGPDETKYKKEATAKNIMFLGEMGNPYPYLKASDYLILTSKFEGFPMVYSEATLLGTGIITTIPVEDEMLRYDGKNIIKLDKNLANFEEVMKDIASNGIKPKIPDINFDNVNKTKMEEFYNLIEEEE